MMPIGRLFDRISRMSTFRDMRSSSVAIRSIRGAAGALEDPSAEYGAWFGDIGLPELGRMVGYLNLITTPRVRLGARPGPTTAPGDRCHPHHSRPQSAASVSKGGGRGKGLGEGFPDALNDLIPAPA